jgi:hypothetical protein
MATAYTESNEPDLFTMEVTLHRKKRSPITVRAVYEVIEKLWNLVNSWLFLRTAMDQRTKEISRANGQ